jgi:hypothetical protein
VLALAQQNAELSKALAQRDTTCGQCCFEVAEASTPKPVPKIGPARPAICSRAMR